MNKPPIGITPPAPGLDREEPDFWIEDDIPTPSNDGRPAARSEPREDRTQGKLVRE